jgi:conjugal transfer ATP-binding protein TraC
MREGTAGLRAMHNIPLRDFRLFLSVKTRARLGQDLRRQVEEQLAKMGIRRLAPEETVSFYRRIFNGLFTDRAGGFADGADGGHTRPIRKQIIDAGPDLAFEGLRFSSATKSRAA